MPVDIPMFGEVRNEALTEQEAWAVIKDENLTGVQVTDVESLIEEFKDLFMDGPGETDFLTDDIEPISDEPIQVKPYWVSPRQADQMTAEVERMLNFEVLEAGNSDCASPMIMVVVPGEDSLPCMDCRRISTKTRDQLYPIPSIKERIETVSPARYISTHDLILGYWQMPLRCAPAAMRRL